jgi:hypothetical protein
MFQKLDRDPYNQHNSPHRYTFIRSCSKTDLSFEWTEWILTEFPKPSPICQCLVSKLYLITHDHESWLEYIQLSTSVLAFRFRTCISTIIRIGHWGRDRISWVESHHGKNHSCIESTSNSILRSHAHPKLSHYFISFKNAAISSPILTIFISFGFHEDSDSVIINGWSDDRHALGTSLRNLFLKRTIDYAKHYYRKSFGL